MNSLRWKLLAWLLPFYLLSAVLAVGVSYLQYQTNVNESMDGQIHTLALSYAHQMPAFSDIRPINTQQVEHDGSLVVQFLGDDGRLLFSSWPIPALALQPTEGFSTMMLHEHSWRVYTSPPARTRVQVIQSGDFRQRVIFDLAFRSAEPVAFLFPITAALLWFAVFLALRPVNRLVQTIAHQDERSLAELPLDEIPSELSPLISSMNGLLVRLKEAFAAQQRFVQDAAHELRTPLTALKLQAEVLRQKLGGSAQDEIVQLEAGLERMQRLVEQLLKLARQETAAPDSAVVDLREVLKESLSALLPIAEARGIDLGFTAAEQADVQSDTRDLRSVFDNLLDNALRYTPVGGRVDVSLHRVDGVPLVEFADTGPGIPPELLERVFDRFYRVLGTGIQGSGLGLAIVRTAAGRSGMHIELLNRSDRTGLVARVRFSEGLSPS